MKQLLSASLLVCMTALSACNQQQTYPRPDHVIVVIEENHGYSSVIGSSNASYITELSREGALFTDAHGVTHPSQPNYLAFFSGSTQGVSNDGCLDKVTPFHSSNLASLLLSHGYTFKGYAQNLPEAGSKACISLTSPLTDADVYARKHCPWVNWQGSGKNNFPDSLSQPMTAFPSDFTELPTFSIVIPDMDHDMHNIGAPGDSAAIRRGDQWLQKYLGAYASWAKTHNSLLIVTFDEDNFTLQNHIPTLIVGGPVKPGHYSERINHYNVLHTIEALYGITPKDDTHAAPIKDIWKM